MKALITESVGRGLGHTHSRADLQSSARRNRDRRLDSRRDEIRKQKTLVEVYALSIHYDILDLLYILIPCISWKSTCAFLLHTSFDRLLLHTCGNMR